MTWDLRERVLIAQWESEGHEVRMMDPERGVAACLRCTTIIHVKQRAQALVDKTFWAGGADQVRPCNRHTRDKSPS